MSNSQQNYRSERGVGRRDRSMKTLVVFLLFVSFACLFIYVIVNRSYFSYAVDYLKAGDLVDQDITAKISMNFVDRKKTEKLHEDIRQTTPRMFRTDDSRAIAAISDFNRIYPESDPGNAHIRRALNDVYSRRYFDTKDIVMDRSENVLLNGNLVPKRGLLHSRTIDSFLKDNYNITESTNPSLSEIKVFIVPNVTYDYASTMQNIYNLISEAQSVVVSYKKDDVIIAKDEIVSEEQIEQLRAIRENESVITFHATALKILISLVMFFLAFYHINEQFKGNRLRSKQFFYYACFSEFLYLALTFFSYYVMAMRSGDYFYDSRSLVFLPSCLVLFLTENRQASFALMILNLILLAMFPYITMAIIAKSFTATMLTVLIYSNRKRAMVSDNSDAKVGKAKRTGRVKAVSGERAASKIKIDGVDPGRYGSKAIRRYFGNAMIALISYMTSVFLIDLSFYASKSIIVSDLIFEAVKIAAVFILTFFITKLFVDVLAMPTKENLVRLIYEDNPLIGEFKQRSKGSFEHCMEVMDIAMMAANAIGCDSLLVGAAARYHDIGKMEIPEYFTENCSNESKHKYLPSKISAGLIKSHVQRGVDLIRRSGVRMPVEALKIIEEHHGDDKISYFLFEAEKENIETVKEKDAGQVDEKYFRYDFDPPTTKESAILMLSDISEAGCRSLSDHSEEQHRKFIHRLFAAKTAPDNSTERRNGRTGGQLEYSNLTVGELRRIEETIVSKINAMYNTHRIKYQGQKS